MLPHPLPVDFLISVTEATMKAHPELCDTGYKKMDRVSSPEKPAVITVVLLSVWCVPSPVLSIVIVIGKASAHKLGQGNGERQQSPPVGQGQGLEAAATPPGSPCGLSLP